MASASSSDPTGQVTQEETPSTSTGAKARGFAAAWASKLGQKASELKNATKDAMQQTKEAFAAEAKMVAKDMADLKEGVAEGMRLTVQDTSQLRERIGQQTRKVFAKEAAQFSEERARPEAAAGEEDSDAAAAASEQKKTFFGPETTEHLKEKVQDLKAGGKKAAEKVRDVGGKLWHKTDHWFHQLRGDTAKEGSMTRSWEECHQHALQLYESGVESNLAWTLEELKTGSLQVYAKSAVIFHHPNDKAAVDELLKSSSGSSECAAPSMACMAAYCQTPLRTENQRCDVHIFSFSQSFFDISSDQAKRQVRDKLKWLCYAVSVCASQHHLSIAWHLPGGASDVAVPLSFEDVSVEGLQELCKMMMKDQLKAFPEVDLTTRLPEMNQSYFDSPGFEETASGTLFVHVGEPWQGAPPSGVFASCTAWTLLCRPATNPCLSQAVALQPPAPEDSSTAPAGLDLLDEPAGPAIVIGDDLLDLEEEEELSREKCAVSVSNGAAGGYPSIEEVSPSAPAASVAASASRAPEVSSIVEEEKDWLDELTADSKENPADSVPADESGGAASDKAKIDADFDALWDSMMDDVGEAPKEDSVANGA